MSLSSILSSAGIDGVTTINCDWVSDRALTLRGFPGRQIQHVVPPEGGWLVPGTWWMDNTLYVFEKDQWSGAAAQWKGRTLTWEAEGRRLIILVPPGVDVQTVNPDQFWYPQIPQIGGQLPDFPLRQPYVRLLKESGRWADSTWSCTSTNDLIFSKTWNRGEIVDQHDEHLLIAVWPPCHIPNWKLYSILMQGLRVVEADSTRSGFRVSVSLSSEADMKPSAFASASQTELHPVEDRPDIIGIRSDRGSPRVLFLHDPDRQCGGGIRLLTDSEDRSTGSDRISIDFGTSHSVAGWYVGSRATCVLTGGDGWNKPFIARAASPQPEYEAPWLLGHPAPEFERIQDEITFIPTGLHLRAANVDAQTIEDWTERLPFVDYSLMGPAIDFEKRAEIAMEAWRSGLKWSDKSGAAEAFLVALLVWAAAVRRGAGGTVRFSAPLAFSSTKRRQFGAMLQKVCETASALTGAPFRLAAPCFSSNEQSKAPQPFVDEATPVIWEVLRPLERHVNERGAGRHGVLVADLGGGTLDLLFASLQVGGGFRLLASESIQFGARAVIEMVDSKVHWTGKRLSDDEQITVKLKEALLEQWARTGELTQAILETWKASDAETAFVREERAHWKGTPRSSAVGIMKSVCAYFFLIREYCARFVAGALSSPDLAGRFGRAPGRDMTGWKNDDPLSIAIALTGNGWRFLPLAGFDSQLDLEAMEENVRASIRTRVGEYLQSTPPNDVSLSEFLGRRKLITAQGMLSLDFKDQERGGTIEVAPNGCTDVVKQVQRPWGTFVSSGEPSYDLPQKQVVRKIDPALADSTDPWFSMCVSAKDAALIFRDGWFTPSEREWNDLTERQGGEIDTRDKSTLRALWETVVRRKLDLSQV
ncbi:MAG TPA: hypothetical protein VNI54_04840 [Thermoanaerobaculia bacterium]|nr:hypothetical protein [Thermoanaerobaculia bacterium]